MITCKHPNCGISAGLSCELGNTDLSNCHHFVAEANGCDKQASAQEEGQRLPWTGRAMGLSDLILVGARSSPLLVGLIGGYNAGKTAFLTSLYALLSSRGQAGNYAFSGSYTLEAWERLKQYTEWPSGFGPSFPPHTPDTPDRIPSLLHLSFRKKSDVLCDVLFTDAPGEWFSRWIQNRSAENAKGARWIVENSSAFLFFVDREALAGPSVGKAKHDTLVMARVLSEQIQDRHITTIWTKSDLPHADEVEKPMREKFRNLFRNYNTVNTKIGDDLPLKIIESILDGPSDNNPVNYVVSERRKTNSAFFAYGLQQ